MDILYIITYFLLWVVTFTIYWRRKRNLDAGWIIILSYLISAGFAIWLYMSPAVYYDFEPLRFFPFVYLFLMLLLALSPVIRFDSKQITSIEQPNMFVLNATACFIIFFSVLYIPSLYRLFQEGGLTQLLTNPEAGQDKYLETMLEAENTGSGIENIPSIVVNAFSDITILLLFYYLSLPKKRWWLIVCLFISAALYTLTPIFSGERGNVVIALMTILAAYFLMRSYFSARLRKWVDRAGLILIAMVTIPIAAITISRFGDREGGAMASVVYYAGQAPLNFNNYGLDAGGIRNGDRTFNLVKRLVDPNTPNNYVERRDKYYYLKMDDNIFYTFVGDFTLDFGPYIAPLIFILFTMFILTYTKPKENKIAFHQLLLIYLVACICMQGSFYLFAYADTAGLKIVVLFILYFVLKYFPNKTSKESTLSCQD